MLLCAYDEMVDDAKFVRDKLAHAQLLRDALAEKQTSLDKKLSNKVATSNNFDASHYYRNPRSDDGTLNGDFTFLVPPHFTDSLKAMGTSFQKIGREMEEGKTRGENWVLTESVKEMHHRLYGNNCKFNAKLGKKHQNQFSDLGDGYLSTYNEDTPEAPISLYVNNVKDRQISAINDDARDADCGRGVREQQPLRRR